MPKNFLSENLDVVFLVYGFSFVVMAIAILIQPRKGTIFRFSDTLGWLAGFGISHGISEWLDMFVVTGHKSTALKVIRYIVLTISYIFLLEFGRKLISLGIKNFVTKGVPFILYFIVFIFIFVSKDDPTIWPRYFLGFPGALLSAFGFRKYYRDNKSILKPINVHRYFFIASISIGLYGVFTGIFVPKADFFPAYIFNSSSFLNTTGIPVQVFRTACAAVLSWSLWNILGIFNWEVKERLENSLELSRQEKEKAELLYKVVPCAIFTIDKERRITSWNHKASQITGYTADEIIGKNCFILFDSPCKEKCLSCSVDSVNPQETKECVIKTKDGGRRVALKNEDCLKDAKGDIIGSIQSLEDITERKYYEQELIDAYNQLKLTQYQLIQAEKMDTVGRLASGVAHEVKNPLAIILQGADYISSKIPADNKDIFSALDRMKDAVNRTNIIVKDLLDFSSATDLDIKAENINSIMENSLFLIKNYIDQNHIEVTKSLQKDIPLCNLDKNKIEQVFINIFMNAIDAMPFKGALKVRTYIETKQGNEMWVIAEIEDFGSGIPENILGKIFDPFFTTKRNKGGSGLGLSVVKSIVDMHRGKVTIQNKMDGAGVKAAICFKT